MTLKTQLSVTVCESGWEEGGRTAFKLFTTNRNFVPKTRCGFNDRKWLKEQSWWCSLEILGVGGVQPHVKLLPRHHVLTGVPGSAG